MTCRVSKKSPPKKKGPLAAVPSKGQTLPTAPVDSSKSAMRQLAKTTVDPEILDQFKAITLSDVCRLLDKSRPFVYRLIRLRELNVLRGGQQVMKLNGQVCITLESFHAYRRRVAAGEV